MHSTKACRFQNPHRHGNDEGRHACTRVCGRASRPHSRLAESYAEPQGSRAASAITAKFQEAGAQFGADAVMIVAHRPLIMGAIVTASWVGQHMLAPLPTSSGVSLYGISRGLTNPYAKTISIFEIPRGVLVPPRAG